MEEVQLGTRPQTASEGSAGLETEAARAGCQPRCGPLVPGGDGPVRARLTLTPQRPSQAGGDTRGPQDTGSLRRCHGSCSHDLQVSWCCVDPRDRSAADASSEALCSGTLPQTTVKHCSLQSRLFLCPCLPGRQHTAPEDSPADVASAPALPAPSEVRWMPPRSRGSALPVLPIPALTRPLWLSTCSSKLGPQPRAQHQ